MAPLILSLCTIWGKEPAFTLGQIPGYLFHRSLSGPNTFSEPFGDEKMLLLLSGFEAPIVRPDRNNFVQCCCH